MDLGPPTTQHVKCLNCQIVAKEILAYCCPSKLISDQGTNSCPTKARTFRRRSYPESCVFPAFFHSLVRTETVTFVLLISTILLSLVTQLSSPKASPLTTFLSVSDLGANEYPRATYITVSAICDDSHQVNPSLKKRFLCHVCFTNSASLHVQAVEHKLRLPDRVDAPETCSTFLKVIAP